MVFRCREVQQALEVLRSGGLSQAAAAPVAEHLAGCAQCRAEAYGRGLPALLHAAAQVPAPAPSEFFLTRLRGGIAAGEAPSSSAALADLMAKAGLRLVPALAAALLLVSFAAAYVATPKIPAAHAAVSAEEVVLLGEQPLSTDLVLAAITGDDIEG